MIHLIPYIVSIIFSANGRPTSYTFTYSSNQNLQSSKVENKSDNTSKNENTYYYENNR